MSKRVIKMVGIKKILLIYHRWSYYFLLLVFFQFAFVSVSISQNRPAPRSGGASRSSNTNRSSNRSQDRPEQTNKNAKSDSLKFEKRNFADDSVNVRFRYLDTARYSGFDSSINDYFKRVPLKSEYIYLGNNGNATRSMLFSPMRAPGWDHGFHAFDPYRFTIEDTKFMNTTKPYTQLGFMIASKAEQNIDLIHTQNISPDWNFVVNYRLINAPGIFNSQNTNHNNIRLNSDFTSKKKRYHAYLILLSNALQSSENGGLKYDSLILSENDTYNDRFNLPTNIASDEFVTRNFFNVKLKTGNRYVDKQILFRQQYDLGKKDSLKTDSTVVYLFFPRLRFEHTLLNQSYSFKFFDGLAENGASFYKDNYDFNIVPRILDYSQRMGSLKNDFSIIQFPDPRNPLQFFKAGASYTSYSVDTGRLNNSFFNVVAHGEYRNRTKNKKWDMLLYGEIFPAGRDAGNYMVQAKLQTNLGKKIGLFELGFQNINRTPSYLFTDSSVFPIKFNRSINTENVSNINAFLYLNPLKAKLTFDYYLVSNYTFIEDYNKVKQSSSLFNFVRLGFNKVFKLTRHWNWYMDVYLQSVAGNAPIHLPWLYTRNRIAYEGNPYRNLVLSTGLEFRYMSSYYADGYSPVLGQFFYQSDKKISMIPDATFFLNFRIRSFTTFLRFENLNTATTQYGFGFKNNNFVAPSYAMPGLLFRAGIFWNFVN